MAKVAYDVLGVQALAITAVSPSPLPEELEEAIPQLMPTFNLIKDINLF